MQNKANVKIGKMNISIATIKDYDKEQRTINNERYSKQTQSKPICGDRYKTKDPRHKTQNTSLESEVWSLARATIFNPIKKLTTTETGANLKGQGVIWQSGCSWT
jgi:hypothetical protein